jgi:hypothetical protein
MHELRPAAKDGGVDNKNIVGLRHIIQPSFDLRGLIGVLDPGDLDVGLDLAQRDRRYKK